MVCVVQLAGSETLVANFVTSNATMPTLVISAMAHSCSDTVNMDLRGSFVVLAKQGNRRVTGEEACLDHLEPHLDVTGALDLPGTADTEVVGVHEKHGHRLWVERHSSKAVVVVVVIREDLHTRSRTKKVRWSSASQSESDGDGK